jgi:23S rRNA (pseudouridine1915-N3)-methyltransferase
MKISILNVGRPKNIQYRTLADTYVRWIGSFFPVHFESVQEGRDADRGRRMDREGMDILKKVRDRDHLVILDERGEEFDSVSFSRWMSERLSSVEGRLVFVVGSAFGLSDEVKRRGNSFLSLSHMTLPHELCLVVLTEQIYRACTLLRGMEYHH